MYIRKTTKWHKGKTYTNCLLVESVTTPEGPRTQRRYGNAAGSMVGSSKRDAIISNGPSRRLGDDPKKAYTSTPMTIPPDVIMIPRLRLVHCPCGKAG